MTLRSIAAIATVGLACLTQAPAVSSAKPASAAPPAGAVVASLNAVNPESATDESRQLVGGSYRVDVYGGMALGNLHQRFRNESEDDVQFVFTVLAQDLFDITALGIESGGRFYELDVADLTNVRARVQARQSRASRAAAPAGSGVAAATPKAAVSEPFAIAAGDSADLVTLFRTALPSTRGEFKLKLPVVAVTQSPGAVLTGPMRIAVAIHHDAPLPSVTSSSHQILVDFEGDRTVIEPVEHELPGTRPFELDFRISSVEQPALAGYVRNSKDGTRELEAVLSPPSHPRRGQRARQADAVRGRHLRIDGRGGQTGPGSQSARLLRGESAA